MTLKLISTILSATICGTLAKAGNIESKVFDSTKIKSVKIENPSGNTLISATEEKSAMATVNVEKIEFPKSCSLSIVKAKDKLSVIVDDEKDSDNCKANITLTLPARTAIESKTGMGNFTSKSMAGSIEFKIGRGDANIVGKVKKLEGKIGLGDIYADGLSGRSELKVGKGNIKVINGDISKIEVKTGVGNIDIAGLTGDSEIKSGTGDVYVKYNKVPKKNEVNIKTGMGDAEISIPALTKVRADLNSGLGKIYNEFGTSDDADVEISMKSGTGDLKVIKTKVKL